MKVYESKLKDLKIYIKIFFVFLAYIYKCSTAVNLKDIPIYIVCVYGLLEILLLHWRMIWRPREPSISNDVYELTFDQTGNFGSGERNIALTTELGRKSKSFYRGFQGSCNKNSPECCNESRTGTCIGTDRGNGKRPDGESVYPFSNMKGLFLDTLVETFLMRISTIMLKHQVMQPMKVMMTDGENIRR